MKRTIECKLKLLVIATGMASVVTQIVVIREMITIFNGNEYVVALILFCWLIFGGLGTWPARFFNPGIVGLGYLSLFFAVLSPGTLLAVRGFRDICFLPGASPGFYAICGYVGITTAPYAFLVGFLLPYTVFCAQSANADFSGTSVYITDNIGDVSGGALFSFLLVFLVAPFQALFVVNILLLAAAGALLLIKDRPARFIPLVSLMSALLALMLSMPVGNFLLVPKTGHLVHHAESRYGRIMVTELAGQYTLFVDGIPVSASQDPIMAEKSVHYTLSQLNKVDAVLLISAEGGMIQAVSKYTPKRIDYVELDPTVTDAAMRYDILKKNAALHTIHDDARGFLGRNPDIRYDAIINSLPDPDTFQLNRFYTEQFLSLARSHLRPGGIYTFSVSGFDNYLTDAQQGKLSILYATASRVFKHVLMLPGERIFFLCANVALNPDIPSLLAIKKIDAPYIRGYFYGDITPNRLNLLKSGIIPGVRINTDFSPRIITVIFSQWFLKFSTSPFPLAIGLILFMTLYLLRANQFEIVLFSSGWALMGAEILVIFAFQIFFGYLYYRIGIIITVFLAGLLPGALIGRGKYDKKWLIVTELTIMALFLLFAAMLFFLNGHIPEIFFFACGLLLSIFCGIQFPIVLNLEKDRHIGVVHAFSADFIGAAFGAVATSLVLLPWLGIIGSVFALIALKCASLATICLGGDHA